MEISANKKFKSTQTIKNFQENVYDHNLNQEENLSLGPCVLRLTRLDTILQDGFWISTEIDTTRHDKIRYLYSKQNIDINKDFKIDQEFSTAVKKSPRKNS